MTDLMILVLSLSKLDWGERFFIELYFPVEMSNCKFYFKWKQQIVQTLRLHVTTRIPKRFLLIGLHTFGNKEVHTSHIVDYIPG